MGEKDSDKATGLTWLLQTGDLEELKSRSPTAEDVNRTLEGGRKPLNIAADFGQADVLKYLISKGADVNAQDRHGFTALLSACYENHLDCVKVLLEEGADKTLKAPDGTTPCEAAQDKNIKALLQ